MCVRILHCQFEFALVIQKAFLKNYRVTQKGKCKRETEVSHTSVPLIHPTQSFNPYKFVANSSQMTWIQRTRGLSKLRLVLKSTNNVDTHHSACLSVANQQSLSKETGNG